MSAPTFEHDLDAGMAHLREAINQAPNAARSEALKVLDDKLVQQKILTLLDDRFKRRHYPRLILGVGVLLMIFIIAFAIIFSSIGGLVTKTSDQDAAIQRSQVSISAFQQQLDAANAKLVAQGLPPVQAPRDPEPGSPDQAKLSVAAATATTLAALPKQTIISSATPVDLANAAAKAVADYFATSPAASTAGPTPQQVIDGVAAYFATNPVPAGPQGAQGLPGPIPTADQITTAFLAAIRDNPQVLCPLGGNYGSRLLALANGGSTTQFGCFTTDTAAPAPPATTNNQQQNQQQGLDPAPTVQQPVPDVVTTTPNTPAPSPTATTEDNPGLGP